MSDRDRTADENAALRARISALSAASLRFNASLDLETVLNEVVESARALTGARYGAIATIDDAGVPQDFVTSGFTAEEHRKLVEWPDGPRLFEYFRDLPGPLRLADVPDYVRSLGFSTDRLPSKTFQGTPMRHRGVHVGNFYLAEKEGGEAFTDGDEEVLVLFALQAATAIANARTYRAEQRAHAGLEALIETLPVGVVVFDAQTGDLVSLNREARRIVEGLCLPGQSAEQLLETITCRRADGREIALARLPLARALSGAVTAYFRLVASSSAPRIRSSTTVTFRRADQRPFPRRAISGSQGTSTTGTTGRVVKIRLIPSSSKATAEKRPGSGVRHRTDPTKSDVSAVGNTWSMNRESWPLAASGIIVSSRTAPSRISRHRTRRAVAPRLWTATPVLMPPSWRRTGTRASRTGGLSPTPATPRRGMSKRRTPPTGPSATTATEPTFRTPRPWVEIVSSPSGFMAVWGLKAPSSPTSRSSVISSIDSAAMGPPS